MKQTTYDERIVKHLELVLEANKTTNLTSISSFNEGMLLHVEDSLLALPEIKKAPKGRYADLGTGGGYPGIPLAIETSRDTLLVDSVQKKIKILDSIIKQLALDNVHTYAGRIEDLGKEQAQGFSVITARALSKLSVLMELSSPLLIQDGILICYKANISDEEFTHALSLQETLGMYLHSDRIIQLDNNVRRIICFKRKGKTKIKLPRKMGFAQKHPL